MKYRSLRKKTLKIFNELETSKSSYLKQTSSDSPDLTNVVTRHLLQGHILNRYKAGAYREDKAVPTLGNAVISGDLTLTLNTAQIVSI